MKSWMYTKNIVWELVNKMAARLATDNPISFQWYFVGRQGFSDRATIVMPSGPFGYQVYMLDCSDLKNVRLDPKYSMDGCQMQEINDVGSLMNLELRTRADEDGDSELIIADRLQTGRSHKDLLEKVVNQFIQKNRELKFSGRAFQAYGGYQNGQQ